MTKHLLALVAALALAFTVPSHGQTTNVAPTVTQPTATTTTPAPVMILTPGKIIAPPAATSALVSTYLAPLLASPSVNLSTPSGAVMVNFSVTFFSDGSSRSVAVYVPSGKLPPPPSR